MTELERDDCYREIAEDTGSIRKLLEKRHNPDNPEGQEELFRFPTIRKAKRVFSVSNVPDVERQHSTFCKTVKTVLLLFVSTVLLAFQGVFR